MRRQPDPAEVAAAEDLTGPELERWRHRYRTARECGLDGLEAELFAWCDADIGELRRLADAGCPGRTLARIVL